MNKKNKEGNIFELIYNIGLSFKKSYLWKLISKFLSVVCTIILIILVIIGSLMFYFNTKAKSYQQKGVDYTPPFGLYTIISGSMEPNVEVYDVVIAKDYDISKLKVGDIITFISNWDLNYGLTVTHRVVGISKNEKGEYQLSTKGDNNGSKDGGTVTQTNLVGKVVGRIPQLGRLQFFLATKMGWFMIVFIPALAVIIFDMIKIFKLYILKNQIDNVKTVKEVENEKVFEKNQPAPFNEVKLCNTTSSLKESDKISKDENIDTVELPKISSTGKFVDHSVELPNLNKKIESIDKTDFLKDLKLVDKEQTIGFEQTNSIPMINDDLNSKAYDSLPKRQIQRPKK